MSLKNIPRPPDFGAKPLNPSHDITGVDTEIWTDVAGVEQWARNVSHPTLTAFLPDESKATGDAVLVIPGGGFQFVSMSNEGWPIARWLAAQGIAAFVLKYRTETTAESETLFEQELNAQTKSFVSGKSLPDAMKGATARACEDAMAAMRLIKGMSLEDGRKPTRVGVLGFSAGAITAMAMTLADEADTRPDFIGAIYGPMVKVSPPKNPPPMFVALAADDPLFAGQGFGLIESWQDSGGVVEFHLFQGGGHGFGSFKKSTTSDAWFDLFLTWMRVEALG